MESIHMVMVIILIKQIVGMYICTLCCEALVVAVGLMQVTAITHFMISSSSLVQLGNKRNEQCF